MTTEDLINRSNRIKEERSNYIQAMDFFDPNIK